MLSGSGIRARTFAQRIRGTSALALLARAPTRRHMAQQPAADTGAPSLFDKIVAKQIPSTPVYEDEVCYAFRDIAPCAPTHILLVPKARDGLSQLQLAEERHKALLGHMLWAAARVAVQEGLQAGYRIVINDGPAGCQSVYHLHIHIIGGRQLSWPPGTGAAEGSMSG